MPDVWVALKRLAPIVLLGLAPVAATVLRPGQRLVVVGSVDQVAVLTERACRL